MDPDVVVLSPSSCEDEDEEQAESVDSGCVADSSSDSSHIEWKQVSEVLREEYSYMMTLLKSYGLFKKKRELKAPETVTINKVIKDVSTTTTLNKPLEEESMEVDPITKDEEAPFSMSSEATTIALDTLSKCRISKVITDVSTTSEKTSVTDSINQIWSSSKSKQEKLHLLQKLLSELKKGKFHHRHSKKETTALHKKLKKKIFTLTKPNNKRDKNSSDQQTDVDPQKKTSDKLSSKPAVQLNKKGGKLVFSKFDFHTPDEGKGWNEDKHNNLYNTLNKVLKEKEQVKKLAAEGKAELASKMLLDKGWDNAMKKAQGLKVKDNTDMLLKSVNKRKNYKQKCQRDWDTRQKSQQESKQTRQRKREENINLKRQRKNEAKSKSKSKKKGRRVPGF